MKCRACAAQLDVTLIDLGAAPPSNAFNATQDAPESHYPLRVLLCTECGLAQTDITLFKLDHDQLFTKDYPYYSSTSLAWVEHARAYVQQMSYSLNLGPDSLTVEVGSNDGYLLQFVKTPCYGVEPTDTAEKANAKGVRTYRNFFGSALARNLLEFTGSKGSNFASGHADLMICNNVLAHVPDINDFVRGFAVMLKPDGVATFEFPHLLNLVREAQFDTIYHEHYSYLSLTAVMNIFGANGLTVFGVKTLPTHGGSLRVFAQKADGPRMLDVSVSSVLAEEECLGDPSFFARLQIDADRIKDDLLRFLLDAKRANRKVAGFGAAAKANTLLNYAGIRSDLIEYVVDDTPAKQGKFMPGSRIPVRAEFDGVPDYIVCFPHNWREEITARLWPLRAQGARLVFAIPRLDLSDEARSERIAA